MASKLFITAVLCGIQGCQISWGCCCLFIIHNFLLHCIFSLFVLFIELWAKKRDCVLPWQPYNIVMITWANLANLILAACKLHHATVIFFRREPELSLQLTSVTCCQWLVRCSTTALSCVHVTVNTPCDCGCVAHTHPLYTRVKTVKLSFLLPGEGFHNYHHTFPFDYATSEFGWRFNLTTAFIDLMCFLGLAKDCKKVSKEMIMARIQRTGDSSFKSGWVAPATNSACETDVSNQDRT